MLLFGLLANLVGNDWISDTQISSISGIRLRMAKAPSMVV